VANLRQLSLLVLGLFFSLALLSVVYIHISYGSRMPRAPQPQVGRVFEINVNHRTVVYVTKEEFDQAKMIFGTMPYLAIFCFAAIGVIKIYWKSNK
jgi:hypothetical protein